MRFIRGRLDRRQKGWLRGFGALLVTLCVLFSGSVPAGAASEFSVKADKHNVFMTFFASKKGYSILAKNAEQMAKRYPKTVQYKIYNDLRSFYSSYRAPKARPDAPVRVYLHAANCGDLVKAITGETAGTYKKSDTAMQPGAQFYVQGSRAYQMLPVVPGQDVHVVILTKIWSGDIIRDAYTPTLYKGVSRVLAAMHDVDGIATAAVGDTAVNATGDIGYEELTEALLGGGVSFDPREWRGGRLGQEIAEAEPGPPMFEPGPWFAWNSLTLPDGWRYMEFVGPDGVLHKPQEVLMALLKNGNLASVSFFSRFRGEGGQMPGAWNAIAAILNTGNDGGDDGDDGGLDLLSSLPPADKVFPGAEIQPLKGSGDDLIKAARHNESVYKRYYSMNAAEPHTRAYQAYTAVETALKKGAFDDVAYFAAEGQAAIEQIVEDEPPKKAMAMFSQLANPKLLPLIRQNIWLASLSSQREKSLEAVVNSPSETVRTALMHNLWNTDNNMAWLAVVPRLTRSGDISPQFRVMLKRQLILNAAWLVALDNLHHSPGMSKAATIGKLPFALAVKQPEHSVKCPIIGFDPHALVENETPEGGYNVYHHLEIATISNDNFDQTIDVDIGLKQRVEVAFSGALDINDVTKTLENIIDNSSRGRCDDYSLMGAFIPSGESEKEAGFTCITKNPMVFNPKRKMFTDYGSFKFRVKTAGKADIKGAYVIEIKRETVRPQSAVQPSPFLSVSRLYNGK